MARAAVSTRAEARLPSTAFALAPGGGLDAGRSPLTLDRVRPSDRATGTIGPAHKGRTGAHFIVGMENSTPSFRPDGQREVTVLVRV